MGMLRLHRRAKWWIRGSGRSKYTRNAVEEWFFVSQYTSERKPLKSKLEHITLLKNFPSHLVEKSQHLYRGYKALNDGAVFCITPNSKSAAVLNWTQQAWSCLGDLMIVTALSVGICTAHYLTPFRPFPKWCPLEVFPDYAFQSCSHLPPCPFYPHNLLFSIVLPTTLILFI